MDHRQDLPHAIGVATLSACKLVQSNALIEDVGYV